MAKARHYSAGDVTVYCWVILMAFACIISQLRMQIFHARLAGAVDIRGHRQGGVMSAPSTKEHMRFIRFS